MVNFFIRRRENMKEKEVKICFAASSGGHFEQLMMLKPLMQQYDSFIITEKTEYNLNLNNVKSYSISQINRSEKFLIFKILHNILVSFRIFIFERPDIIITTGVLAMIPICMIAKIFGKKLIYIESFAKINSPTRTGKFLYRFADRFYVQWESMLKFYPKAIFMGGIY